MKVVHLATVAPHQNGLYETTRDMVAAEIGLGIDSRIVESYRPPSDRGVPIGDGGQVVAECDVVVNHNGLGWYADVDKPIVHVFHGRPDSSFRLEQTGQSPVYSSVDRMRNDKRFKAFITLWESHVPYWELLVGTVEVAPPPVDLEAWCPGESDYDFNGYAGGLNVVCADAWRIDKTPFHLLTAFSLFAKQHPEARLHVYGAPENDTALEVILARLREQGCLGEVWSHVNNLVEVYRAADLVISPHKIATRAIREALACGCPVVMGKYTDELIPGTDPEESRSFASLMDVKCMFHRASSEAAWRQYAEYRFDSKKTAIRFKEIYEKVLE